MKNLKTSSGIDTVTVTATKKAQNKGNQRSCTVLNRRDRLTDDALKMISGAVSRREDKPLSANEKKLCSILLRKMFKDKDWTGSTVKVLDIAGGTGTGTAAHSFKIARVPNIYSSMHKTRTGYYHVEVATDWMSILPLNMQDKLLAKRVLKSALSIHNHETHSGSIVEEADGAQDTTKILAAHGK